MKAMIWKRYGSSSRGGAEGLELQEIDDPVPGEGEIRVRVRASSVSTGDCEVRSLKFRFPLSLFMRAYVGLLRPKRIRILGQELAGVVDAVGAGVANYQVGDAVFAQTDFTMGGHAEYRCFVADPEKTECLIAPKPANLTFEQAAVAPLGGVEALKFLKAARVEPGERVLIIGGGGSIGTMATQIAKHYGAEVTAIDGTEKLDLLRGSGADRVIDYTAEDFTARRGTYHVIFDVVGKLRHRRLLPKLEPAGRVILANPTFPAMIRGSRTGKDGICTIAGTSGTVEHLLELTELIEAGAVTPVLDRTYSLEEAPEAFRYVESGRKQGGVAVVVPAE